MRIEDIYSHGIDELSVLYMYVLQYNAEVVKVVIVNT